VISRSETVALGLGDGEPTNPKVAILTLEHAPRAHSFMNPGGGNTDSDE